MRQKETIPLYLNQQEWERLRSFGYKWQPAAVDKFVNEFERVDDMTPVAFRIAVAVADSGGGCEMWTNAVAEAVGQKAAGRKRSMVQSKRGVSYMRLTVYGSVPDDFGHSCLPSRWNFVAPADCDKAGTHSSAGSYGAAIAEVDV